MPTLLYLHGFRSSPQSAKARATAQRVEQINRQRAASGEPLIRWLCPQLPPSPREAMRMCEDVLGNTPGEALRLIGSSLGGFYATYLAHTFGARAALLNPAVDPARDLRGQIGTLAAWHDPALQFDFTAAHVEELHALEVGNLRDPVPNPQQYFVIIAQGDEVLDWREMAARYRGAQCTVLPGGDHALSDYAQQHLDPVLRWCLGTAPRST
ncbi:MAG: YqiA/YcfP family alpha/beta fold hydrolase [Thiomonas sp.]